MKMQKALGRGQQQHHAGQRSYEYGVDNWLAGQHEQKQGNSLKKVCVCLKGDLFCNMEILDHVCVLMRTSVERAEWQERDPQQGDRR
jgi:hypothetical protein